MRRGPALTVDALAILDGRIVLVRRARPPFQGMYALPGGFVEYGETVEEAVAREFREETGLEGRPAKLLGVYSAPDRDPRGHTVSIVFLMDITGGSLRAGDDAAAVETFPPDDLPGLAFDHGRIIGDYLASH